MENERRQCDSAGSKSRGGFARFLRSGIRVAVLTLACSSLARADEAVRRRPQPILRLDSELEYYLPTKRDRTIHSLFANVLIGVQLLRRVLVLEAGLTVTGAWGYITQLDESLHAVRLDTSVFGAGPIVLVRCEPFHIGRFSLSLDVLGGVIVYSAHFPPGGDIYNFTWRLGGVLIVRVSERVSLAAGARWMHVSNGQGLTPHNPSYEGVGFPVTLQYRF